MKSHRMLPGRVLVIVMLCLSSGLTGCGSGAPDPREMIGQILIKIGTALTGFGLSAPVGVPVPPSLYPNTASAAQAINLVGTPSTPVAGATGLPASGTILYSPVASESGVLLDTSTW